MLKEIRIPHSEIQDSQTITEVMRRKFREKDLNIHVHGVEDLVDDYGTGERILKVKNTKYFIP